MELSVFKKLSTSNFLVHFITRSYSLELLFILSNSKKIEGIETLYLKIVSAKPTYPAFKTYLYFFKDKGCIKIKNEANKKNAKTLEPDPNTAK